jgi:hypothetical protein
MSLSGVVVQLHAIAVDMPLHEQQEVINRLESMGARVSEQLGSDHPESERIQGAINHAMSLSSDTFSAMENITQIINDVVAAIMGS